MKIEEQPYNDTHKPVDGNTEKQTSAMININGQDFSIDEKQKKLISVDDPDIAIKLHSNAQIGGIQIDRDDSF